MPQIRKLSPQEIATIRPRSPEQAASPAKPLHAEQPVLERAITGNTARVASPRHKQASVRSSTVLGQPVREIPPAHGVAQATIPGPQSPHQPRPALLPATPVRSEPIPPVAEPESNESLHDLITGKLRPVQIQQAERRGEQIHLTLGDGSTLCGVACSTELPAARLTYGVAWDCQRCAVLLHRLQARCPVCHEPLKTVSSDGRCTRCKQENRSTRNM